MPSLNWIGKQAVEHHHKDVPYRLVHCDSRLSVGDANAGNLLVQGDNLEALKALLPYYAGKVKCIYIDPPYNTGNEGWEYNDNVNSPEIRQWLGKAVGREADDLSRHDKWLCMMYPRLRLLKEFLSEDGVILVSIDDNEFHSLRFLLQDVFKSNFVSTLVWVNEGNIDNQSKIKQLHEYVLVFEKRRGSFGAPALVDPNIGDNSKLANENIVNTIVKNGPKNPVSGISLPAGFPANFESGEIAPRKEHDFWPKFDETIHVDNFKLVNPVVLRSGWSSKSLCELFIAGKYEPVIDRKGQQSRFYLTKTGAIFNEKLRTENQSHVLSVLHNMGSVQESASELAEMGIKFSYPKPRRLLEYLIRMTTGPDDLVLDSFAGSGTTGHAVLSVNQQFGGNRKFILVEMERSTAVEITSRRLAAAIAGYGEDGRGSKRREVKGLGSGFRYCELGSALFNEFGDIALEVSFSDLAAHVFFAETGTPIPTKAQVGSSYLGQHNEKAVYLLYGQSDDGMVRNSSANVLTPDALADLPLPPAGFEGVRVVYAEGTTVSSDRLRGEGVVFKQIPYQIEGI